MKLLVNALWISFARDKCKYSQEKRRLCSNKWNFSQNTVFVIRGSQNPMFDLTSKGNRECEMLKSCLQHASLHILQRKMELDILSSTCIGFNCSQQALLLFICIVKITESGENMEQLCGTCKSVCFISSLITPQNVSRSNVPQLNIKET